MMRSMRVRGIIIAPPFLSESWIVSSLTSLYDSIFCARPSVKRAMLALAD